MLNEQQQVRGIANGLAGYGLVGEVAGVERMLRPDGFEEPWRTMAWAIVRAERGGERAAVLEALADRPEGEVGRLLAIVAGVGPSRRFLSLAEIAADLAPIEWLWRWWIPLGMITLLGAVPGAGKTFVALDLAKRLVAGEGWPDGSAMGREGARVVYVDAESVPQIINERVERWGMDKGALYLMSPAEGRLFIDFSESVDREYLTEMAYHVDPALVVVDSLSSISSRGENSVEDVRTVLSFLNQLAQDMQCGLILIHHLRKGTRGGVFEGVVGIDDFRGSGHIIAMARSVLGLSVVQTGPELDRNGPRRLEVVKTNLCRYPGPIGVEFVEVGEGVALRYGDAPEAYRELSKLEECERWLVGVLEEAGEAMRPKAVVELGQDEGFSERTIYRARKGLEGTVVNTDGLRHPENRWGLGEAVEQD